MATHSSILTWRIPWTEEPGGPQSIGSPESDMTFSFFNTFSTGLEVKDDITEHKIYKYSPSLNSSPETFKQTRKFHKELCK